MNELKRSHTHATQALAQAYDMLQMSMEQMELQPVFLFLCGIDPHQYFTRNESDLHHIERPRRIQAAHLFFKVHPSHDPSVADAFIMDETQLSHLIAHSS